MVGGGALSLPYAFSQAGIGMGTILLLICSLATWCSIYVLISSSRRSGGLSFKEVCERTLGSWGGLVASLADMFVTGITCIAYCVLLRDVAPPLIEATGVDIEDKQTFRTIVMLACVAFMTPFTFLRDRHNLLFLSVFSTLSLLALALCLCYQAHLTAQSSPGNPNPSLELESQHALDKKVIVWFGSFGNCFRVFPIFVVCFTCQFNVLPMHCDLIAPSRRRIKRSVFAMVGVCTALYLVVALAGYLACFQTTMPDIFVNFKANSAAVTVARVCFVLNIILSYPLVFLPCRASIAELSQSLPGYFLSANHAHHLRAVFVQHDRVVLVVASIALTAGLVGLATTVENVEVLWDMLGSTAGPVVVFLLPAMAYLKVRRPQLKSSMTVPSWMLIIIGLFTIPASIFFTLT
eukprot:c14334_g1_i3.p1 GENE.c14334_g1_i3~~c14334_g1_i3.p1  ORF type:complete len:407 (+),score=70.02 c14334_g1_i3:580-1800(+)